MNLKILLVDDDEIVLFLHKTMIIDAKISSEPVLFSNGKYAFDYLCTGQHVNNFYFVLLDINMPVMDGWGFLRAIQSKPIAKQLSVILVTSSIDKLDKEKAKSHPLVIDFIEKPLTLKECERIKSLTTLK